MSNKNVCAFDRKLTASSINLLSSTNININVNVYCVINSAFSASFSAQKERYEVGEKDKRKTHTHLCRRRKDRNEKGKRRLHTISITHYLNYILASITHRGYM